MNGRVIALAASLAVFASILGAGIVMAMPSYAADEIRDWTPVMNQEEFWENELGPGWVCTKVDEAGAFETKRLYGQLIIKAGQKVYIWKPAPRGEYTTPQGVSHWTWCDGPDKVLEPKLDIKLSCVAKAPGKERKWVRYRVPYSTGGIQRVLFRRLVVDGKIRMRNYWDVWADDLALTTHRYVGFGKHRIRAVAKMGELRVVKTKTIYCDLKPVVEILGPCDDPVYGVQVKNRTAARKHLVVKLDGRKIIDRWLPRYSLVIVGPFYASPGADIEAFLDGKLVKSEESVGGNFGWGSGECQTLKAGVQYA